MPDTIIKGLTDLFKVPLSIDVHTNIYKILNEHYQTNLVPILKKATKAQLNPWAAIAAAAEKKHLIPLIEKLAANKKASTKQLLQVMRFQRALLGRGPYFVTTDKDSRCDSLILLHDPLVNFLKKTAKKSQKTPTSLNDALVVEPLTPDDLHHYWVPYSTLFADASKENDQTLSQVDILEIVTAVITEEPHRFQELFIKNKRFEEKLNALTKSEIVSLFEHKKLTDAHFETIFGHLSTLENGKKLSTKHCVAICATQPSALKYFCKKDEKNSQSPLIEDVFIETLTPHQDEKNSQSPLIEKGFIKTLTSDQIEAILTKKKIKDQDVKTPQNKSTEDLKEKIESYYYSENEFYDALSMLQNKNKCLTATELTLKTDDQKKLDNALTEVKVAHKILAIAKLAENPSLKNLSEINEIVSLRIFNETQAIEILTIIEKIPSQYKNLSTGIIKNLLKSQRPEAIKKICSSNPNAFRVFFKNKIKNQGKPLSTLKITELAKLIANFPEKNETITYLETRFIEKISVLVRDKKVTGNTISESLLTILNAKNNANNAKIFEFIYCNRKFDFLPYINEKHLAKSFSNQLDKNDDSLKRSLINILSRNNSGMFKFQHLTQHTIFSIFLEAEKNAYSLPLSISEKLVDLMVNNGADPNYFTNLLSQASNHTENSSIKEIGLSIIFHTHRYVYYRKTDALYLALYNNVIIYLKANPVQLVKLIATQAHHSGFIHLLDDPSISELLNCKTILEIFLIAQYKNIDLSQPIKNYLITRLLKEEDIMQSLSNFVVNQNFTHSSSKKHTSSNSNSSNSSQTQASYADKNVKKTQHALIIEIHQKTYGKNKTQSDDLIALLDKDNFIYLLQYQSKHPHLVGMFSDPNLLAKITPEIALELLTTVTLIPHAISETLFNKIFSLSEFNIETVISDKNTTSNARAALLLAALSFSNRNATWSKKLTDYLVKSPGKIADIFLHGVNKPGFNLDIHHLLAFIQTQKILDILQETKNRQCLHLAFLNVSQSSLNIENKMQLIHKLMPTFSQEDIVDIFAQAKKNTSAINLPRKIRRLLVEELNFKKLPQLIAVKEKQIDPKKLKGALETIYRTQIEHQIKNEKKVSIPALFLCLPYAALYYFSIIGLVLHFVLPITRPSGLYAWLKRVFSPKQIEVEFTEKFNKKVWLGKIADKTPSIAEEEIIPDEPAPINTSNSSSKTIYESTTNTPSKNSLINLVTGEIEPVCGETNPSYTYLFPATKERLDHKIHPVKTKIKALKNSGALFRPDKNSYFINDEEKELFLAGDFRSETLPTLLKGS